METNNIYETVECMFTPVCERMYMTFTPFTLTLVCAPAGNYAGVTRKMASMSIFGCAHAISTIIKSGGPASPLLPPPWIRPCSHAMSINLFELY